MILLGRCKNANGKKRTFRYFLQDLFFELLQISHRKEKIMLKYRL